MLSGIYSHVLNGFLLSVFMIVGLKAVARDLQLVDLPDARKRHHGEIPLCGGLAIFGAFIVSGLGLEHRGWLPWNWALGFLVLVLIGVADDRWRLPPFPRLAIQALGAVILSTGAASVLVFGTTSGTAWHLVGPLLTLFMIIFVVGTANAINMLDGADGLAGATVTVALLWLALIGNHTGDRIVELQALVLAAAILGFLVFNMRHPWRPAASIFMGDAGSMLLGGALATFILHLSDGHGSSAVSYVALLWVVIVPICDTLSLMVRRAAVSRSPLSSDRWHLHHLLLDRGVPPAAIAPLIATISGLCGAVSYFGIIFRVPDLYLGLGLLVPVLAHTAFVLRAQSKPAVVHAPAAEVRLFRRDAIVTHTNEAVG